jgi:hypothetical protein
MKVLRLLLLVVKQLSILENKKMFLFIKTIELITVVTNGTGTKTKETL